MAKKKSFDYTPIVLGAGAVGLLAWAFKDEIKKLFKPEDTTTDDTQTDENLVIEQIVTPAGVTPVATTVTNKLSPLGTPKDKLNMDVYLKKGDRGQEVAKMQQILNRIAKITGSIKITEDGIFGDGTQSRLQKMFGDISKINLYKLYVALYAIYAADKGKQPKKWFNVYQTFLASDQLRNAARSEYFKNNAII
jgi:hypothetical protein